MLTKFKDRFTPIFESLYKPLDHLGLPPNAITLAGLALCIAGYVSLKMGSFELFIALFVLSSLADALDGYVARKRSKTTRFGAFLDSFADRLEDTIFGLALYDLGLLGPHEAVFLVAGFLLVSYARSRSESLGVSMAGVGIVERAERLALIFLALLLSRLWFAAARATVLALLIATYVTVLQRVIYAYRRL